MPKPDFFIVGAPKSGTTSLYAYLQQHPDVFMPEVKEPAYFGADLHFVEHLCVRDTIHHLDNYLRIFDAAGAAKRIGEGTTFYLYSKQAAREIREFDPDARILIMLRNPVDMLYSLHGEFLWNCNEDIEDFEEGLNAQEDRARGRRIPPTACFPQGLQYYEVARLSVQVARYIDTFPPDQVHIIIFDDFQADTPAGFKHVLRFLDLDATFTPDFSVHNVAKPTRALGVNRFFAARPSLRKALNAVLGNARRKRFIDVCARLSGSAERTAKLDPHLRTRLQALFLPEVEQLSALLGRDLTHWCRSPGDELPDAEETPATGGDNGADTRRQ